MDITTYIVKPDRSPLPNPFVWYVVNITKLPIFTINRNTVKMSRNYKFNNPEGFYFISCAIVGWLDVFIRNEYKDLFLESVEYLPVGRQVVKKIKG